MSLVHLRDGSWMAAYVVTNSSPQQVEISRSTNDMQSWQRIQTIMATDSSALGALQLAQSPSGTILLAVTAVLTNRYYSLEVYSWPLNGNAFSWLSNIDTNTNYANGLGFFAPFLYVLPNGNIAAFYADQQHETIGYSQLIGERYSTDNGQTWSAETIAAGIADGASLLGNPYVTLLANGYTMLSFQDCPSAACSGSTSYTKISPDGVTWDSSLGTELSSTGPNMIAQSFVNGLLLRTSDDYNIYYSQDYGATWTAFQNPAFSRGAWPSFYQVRTDEVAAMQGMTIVFGTMSPLPYHDVFNSGNAGDFAPQSGTWTMTTTSTSGIVYSNTSGGQGEASIAGGSTWRDYTLQADLRLNSLTGTAGLVARYSKVGSVSNGYYAGVDATTKSLVLADEQTGSTLASESITGAFTTTTWIDVTIQAVNCTITATAQPRTVQTVTTLTYTDPSCTYSKSVSPDG